MHERHEYGGEDTPQNYLAELEERYLADEEIDIEVDTLERAAACAGNLTEEEIDAEEGLRESLEGLLHDGETTCEELADA